jgi:hypothetical protein
MTAGRLAGKAGASTELEVSTQKVRIQTSVVGIVVLIVSGLFLLLFLRDVYRIDVIGLSPAKGNVAVQERGESKK